MIGRLPKDHARAWQLISVNMDRQCSSALSVIVEKLLTLVCAHAHLPIIFSIQEMRSWNVPELQLPGLCVMVAKLGSPRWWFRISFSKLSDL